MVRLKTYRFNFDIEPSRRLRDAVNDKQNLSIEKESTLKDIGGYLAWDRICAIMDRIDDIITHLNSLELGNDKNRSAFDFYEFVSCAAVLIDCIKHIAQIFNVDENLINDILDSNEVFGSSYAEKGTDGKFFEYIRSLCIIHPTHTNRQKEYLGRARFHCCPFVTWNHIMFLRSDGDLTATVYTSTRGVDRLQIPLYLKQFEAYVQKWISFIEKVIEAIRSYNDDVYDRFRKIQIKKLISFNGDVVEYLKNLKLEYDRRFGDDHSYIFDEYIRVFSVDLTNKENKEKLLKYQNAILYAMQFLENALQNMSFDGFENSGIKYPDKCVATDLFLELSHIFSMKSAFAGYSYNLEKVYYLETGSFWDKDYARRLLEQIKPIINRFVVFDNNESDEETLVLVQLAKYFDALNESNLLNRNIPNEEKYRMKVLNETEYRALLNE